MRAHLLAAMVVLALTSVAVTAVVINRAVDAELRDFSRRDLHFSAVNAAEMAAAAYLEADGWSARAVRALRTIARARGDAIAVVDGDGRAVPGSPPPPAGQSERAIVLVGARHVGTVIASHPTGVGVGGAAHRLDLRLRGRMDELLLAAGTLAGSLALLLALAVALRVARPLHRLTEVASRMAAGEIETRATGSGGGREMRRLANTMDRLAAALRRQDELRRATASDVTHELRGALVGVVARVEALQHGFADDPHAVVGQIGADARRLHRLVDDVDRLAEAQRPGLLVHKRPIDLDAIVRSCVAAYADECASRSIALSHRIAPARVEGDPQRLRQVLDNLLSNALRYTDAGGRVGVRLDVRGDEAVLEVSDTGIGIAPEHLGRIFDRFWRAPQVRARAAEGSGVGLALVSELVRAHDGRVDVSSSPGRGSSFRVFLGLGERALASPAARPGSAGPEIWRRRGALGAAGAPADAPLAG